MSLRSTIYCLDANVLIKAWESYYSPNVCPTYWNVLDELGSKGQLFVPSGVAEEIHRTDDDLSKWLKKSRIKVRSVTEEVGIKVKEIFAKDKRHELLVDNTKHRSLADPWLIAHAMVENACVVSKESKSTAAHNKKVKIPDVCEAMDVRCIDDFKMIEELGIKFTCTI